MYALEDNETGSMPHADKCGVRRKQFYVIDLINKYYTAANETPLNFFNITRHGNEGINGIYSAFGFISLFCLRFSQI